MPEIISTVGFPVDDTGAVIAPADAQPLQAPVSASWDYEQSNAVPAAGFAYQSQNGRTLTINKTDHGAVDRTAFLTQLTPTSTITCNGVTWNVTSVSTAGNTFVIGIAPSITAPPFGVATITINSVTIGTGAVFPVFTPIIPPPLISNPPPPAFPPPSAVPVGPLVGPAIVPASVPPSVAGITQPQFRTGSATSPPANGYFTQFTTTPYTGFPNQPPNGVPIVFSNTNNFAVAAAGQTPPFTWPAPPSTPTTAQITINGYAPVWSGSAVMAAQETGSAGAIHQRNAGPPQRRRRPVLHRPDAHP